MANAYQLQMLKQSVSEWNKWRTQNFSASIDLSKADLRKADLTGAYLSDANLFWANLAEADLTEADLKWVDLRKANLAGANLTEADLTEADLREADLTEANLLRADLIGASINKANLSKTVLTWANLSLANLSEANLSKATLLQTVLGNVVFVDAIGLETCQHDGPSIIDHRTLELSKNLPINFLRGCGLSDLLIDYLPSLRGQAIEFYSCFISHSYADKAFARRLHDQLQSRGIRCWLDEHQIGIGEKIIDAIDRGIRLWDKVILCCSQPALKNSWWVEDEIDRALTKERQIRKKPEGRRVHVIVPLDLDGYIFEWDNALAGTIRERRVADFIGWETDNNKFETELDRLIKTLRTDEDAGNIPPKPKL